MKDFIAISTLITGTLIRTGALAEAAEAKPAARGGWGWWLLGVLVALELYRRSRKSEPPRKQYRSIEPHPVSPPHKTTPEVLPREEPDDEMDRQYGKLVYNCGVVYQYIIGYSHAAPDVLSDAEYVRRMYDLMINIDTRYITREGYVKPDVPRPQKDALGDSVHLINETNQIIIDIQNMALEDNATNAGKLREKAKELKAVMAKYHRPALFYDEFAEEDAHRREFFSAPGSIILPSLYVKHGNDYIKTLTGTM